MTPIAFLAISKAWWNPSIKAPAKPAMNQTSPTNSKTASLASDGTTAGTSWELVAGTSESSALIQRHQRLKQRLHSVRHVVSCSFSPFTKLIVYKSNKLILHGFKMSRGGVNLAVDQL